MHDGKARKRRRDAVLEKVLTRRFVAAYLYLWARLVLRIRKPFIIGVTGSVGKTTTTEMIAAVLTHRESEPSARRVRKTVKNMNDDVGLPMTVLGYDDWLAGSLPSKFIKLCSLPFRALRMATTMPYPDILVLEYGTHWQGHLDRLAKLAPPNIAVVTTIGPAHLDRLKTLEGVVSEKTALVRAVPRSGLVILGEEHDYVSHIERVARVPVRKVAGRGIELSKNITCVVCSHLGIPESITRTVLRDFKPPQGRLHRLNLAAFTVIDDTFNANPLSMKLALDTLEDTAKPGQRRLAILGIMGELGEESARYHEDIGAYARSRADVVIGVGALAKHYGPDHWFEDSDACTIGLEPLVRYDDCVLVKGSHSARMGRVVERLREIYTRAPEDV